MDLTLVYLALAFAPYVVTYLYRKRLVRWFSAQLAQSIVAWAFVTKEVEGEEGKIVEIKAVSEPARALLAALTPALIAEVMKSIKVKPSGTVPNLQGVDLSNLSSALPAILPMLPKKWQPLAALAAPFLGSIGLGGTSPEKKSTSGGENPFLKKLKES